MTDRQITLGNRTLILETLRANEVPQSRLDAAAGKLFALFAAREKEFGFNPDVQIDYPDLAPTGPFLTDPLTYLETRRANAAREGRPFGRAVVLTTYAERVGPALIAAGYKAAPIDMPAGPDHTAAFTRPFPERTAPRVLYLEAVNETDEKIRPSFALRLPDPQRRLLGGACGSVHLRDGRRYAYLAMMTLAPGLPPGTGTALGEALLAFLRQEG